MAEGFFSRDVVEAARGVDGELLPVTPFGTIKVRGRGRDGDDDVPVPPAGASLPATG